MLKEHFKGVMVRKVFEDIQGSQWATIKQWVEDHGLEDHFVFQKAPLEIICTETDARLIARGMNNPGRSKSIPGLSLAWYEEADELDRDDLEQTSLSIRGEGIEEWLTFNSPAVDHWLIEEFFPGYRDDNGRFVPDLSFERPDGMFTFIPSRRDDAVIFHSCYKHNPFCKQSFIDIQDGIKERAPERYRSSGLGLLGQVKTGKEFFWAYDGTKHAKAKYTYDPTKPLHLGFDFNRAPHMTLIVSQVHKEERELRDVYLLQGLKEYCLEHPFNKTESVCKAFLKDVNEGMFKGHQAGIFVYGDYSGKTGRTTEMEGIRNDYDVVWHILGRFFGHGSDRVLPNPLHYKVSRWMNACFGGFTNVEICFDPSMINTNRDYQTVKEDADGSMLKEYATDRVTGKRYEKNGHCAQASYYIATSLFRDSFDAYKD